MRQASCGDKAAASARSNRGNCTGTPRRENASSNWADNSGALSRLTK